MTAIETQDRMTDSPVIRGRTSYLEIVVAACTMVGALFMGVQIMPSLGLGLFAYCVFWFLNTTGEEIAIAPVVSLIASAQWILGAYFAYYHDAITIKYYMYVSEEKYFSFVVPSLIMMILIMRYFSPVISIARIREYIVKTTPLKPENIYYIFVIGLIAQRAGPFLPESLKFIVFVVAQFMFIANIYLLVLRMRFRWLCLAISFGMALMYSLEYSLFHVLLLWSTLIASYICAELRIRFSSRLILFVLAILFVVQLQSAKSEYRLRILQNPESAGISTLLNSMVENSMFENSQFSSTVDDTGLLNARLNQGWIISAVMNYVPAVQPHENGRTIISAIQESILPRFLFEKRTVQVSDSFTRYSGLSVAQNTSFGISILGEAWVNFGIYGIAFMGAFGAFYAFVFRFIVRISRTYPTFIFWMPLIFLQGVKAETELVVMLNHIVKSGILIVMFYVFAYKVMKWRI